MRETQRRSRTQTRSGAKCDSGNVRSVAFRVPVRFNSVLTFVELGLDFTTVQFVTVNVQGMNVAAPSCC